MIPKTFALDFARAIIDYKLSLNDNVDYFSNDNHNGIANYSFFEHLKSNEAVNRYVKTFEDLTKQQNRTSLAGFGILSTNESPTITNLYDAFISPFEFNYVIRCLLKDRDKMLGTLYHLIDELKGRKVDVAQLDTGVLFPVGTITDVIHNGDFIGNVSNTTISTLLTYLYSLGIPENEWEENDYLYAEKNGKLARYEYINELWVENETYFIGNLEHNSFNKFKVSLSLNDISINQPFTLNALEYITFEMGGSATLVNDGVRLGNDLVRVYIKKHKVVISENSNNDIYFDDLAQTEGYGQNEYTELEPLEIPSNANANTIANQLRSNFFIPNSHTDSVGHSIQYSFVCDMGNDLLRHWFNYARYHECNLGADNIIQYESITPNIIYKVKEQWSSWGVVEFHEVLGKLNEDVDIENTEADITTLNLSFQLQGVNN